MSLDSDFTALANPDFDLRQMLARSTSRATPTNLSAIPFREMLVVQPPLAPGERLPRMLALEPGEPALVSPTRAATLNSQGGSGYIKTRYLDWYIPARHFMILDLIQTELADSRYSTTHGTSLTYKAGCPGPLCRRARREANAEMVELRRQRLARKAPQTRQERYAQLRQRVPHYAAVEPLLFSYTVFSHRINRPRRPTSESKTYLMLDATRGTAAYMRAVYAPDVDV